MSTVSTGFAATALATFERPRFVRSSNLATIVITALAFAGPANTQQAADLVQGDNDNTGDHSGVGAALQHKTENLNGLPPPTSHLQASRSRIPAIALTLEGVGKIYPEAVIRDHEGLAQHVRYDELVSMLLIDLQQQKAQLAQQSNELQDVFRVLAELNQPSEASRLRFTDTEQGRTRCDVPVRAGVGRAAKTTTIYIGAKHRRMRGRSELNADPRRNHKMLTILFMCGSNQAFEGRVHHE